MRSFCLIVVLALFACREEVSLRENVAKTSSGQDATGQVQVEGDRGRITIFRGKKAKPIRTMQEERVTAGTLVDHEVSLRQRRLGMLESWTQYDADDVERLLRGRKTFAGAHLKTTNRQEQCVLDKAKEMAGRDLTAAERSRIDGLQNQLHWLRSNISADLVPRSLRITKVHMRGVTSWSEANVAGTHFCVSRAYDNNVLNWFDGKLPSKDVHLRINYTYKLSALQTKFPLTWQPRENTLRATITRADSSDTEMLDSSKYSLEEENGRYSVVFGEAQAPPENSQLGIVYTPDNDEVFQLKDTFCLDAQVDVVSDSIIINGKSISGDSNIDFNRETNCVTYSDPPRADTEVNIEYKYRVRGDTNKKTAYEHSLDVAGSTVACFEYEADKDCLKEPSACVELRCNYGNGKINFLDMNDIVGGKKFVVIETLPDGVSGHKSIKLPERYVANSAALTVMPADGEAVSCGHSKLHVMNLAIMLQTTTAKQKCPALAKPHEELDVVFMTASP